MRVFGDLLAGGDISECAFDDKCTYSAGVPAGEDGSEAAYALDDWAP